MHTGDPAAETEDKGPGEAQGQGFRSGSKPGNMSGSSRIERRSLPQVMEDKPSVGADLVGLYRDLHAHPELSGQEHRTASLAAERVEDAGFKVTTGWAARASSACCQTATGRP